MASDQRLGARKVLLAREKEFTRLRDELDRLRRDLPWEAMSRAPHEKLAAYRKRMSWNFRSRD